MAFGNGSQRAALRQTPLLDGAVGGHRDAALSERRDQIELGASARDVVENLVGGGGGAAGRRELIRQSRDDTTLRLILPARLKFSGGRAWVIGTAPVTQRRPDRALVSALKASHIQLAGCDAAPHLSLDRLRNARGLPDSHQRSLARMAFLAPDLQEALLKGELPVLADVGALTAADLPLAWADQRAWLQSRS